MSRGINKVTLIGNVGQDPLLKSFGETIVANFSIATGESWTDRESGEKKTKTEWHKIVLYNKLAQVAEKYLAKGSKVYLEGKLQTRKWQDKSGIDRYTTEIIGSEIQILEFNKKDEIAEERNQEEKDLFNDDIPF